MPFERVELPRHALAQLWVRHYLFVDVDSGGRVVTRTTPARPDTFIQFIIEGSHDLVDIATGAAEGAPPVTLVGPYSHRRIDLRFAGRLRLVIVQLEPAAPRLLFGANMRGLANGFAPLPDADDLLARLRGAAQVEEQIEMLDRWIETLASAAPASDAVALAAKELRDSHGATKIAALAAQAGMSPRQFQRRFADAVGLAPKAYARTCRVSYAIQVHEADPARRWSDIAAECGYADQAHLNHDFRELQRQSPMAFRRFQSAAPADRPAVP